MDFSFLVEEEDRIDANQRDGGEMRRFSIAQAHSERMATQPTVSSNETTDTAMVLQQILETLGRMELRQETLLNRLTTVESALAEKMPERAEVQHAKTHRSVSRITGDVGSEEQILLQSLLPMSSEETLKKMEEHLNHKAHADAMAGIIFKLKSTKGTIEKVLQSLFSDELVWLYNCDGKAGKKALIKLKIVDLTLAQNTIFGWILSGLVTETVSTMTTEVEEISNECLNSQLRKFWELEELPPFRLQHEKISIVKTFTKPQLLDQIMVGMSYDYH
ncbi:uncharacterized protein LOC128920122 [Zeugodacus cucurbitae]|uniref:uncharacterized protein LOC128920122 n=1 Tax=Zeugodacus cucurbitae TaxID=28588 RepID=UPI0023D8E350|nr:uncharacterized protein LOC128920122 [Zeugodacus cucurbitae]